MSDAEHPPGHEPAGHTGEVAAHTSEEVPWGGTEFESGEADGSLRTQMLLYGMVAFFFFVIGTGYWFVTYEAAGTVMLLLAGMVMATIAAYLGYPRHATRPRRRGTVPGARRRDEAPFAEQPGVERPTEVEITAAPEARAWFPSGSLWPFTIGVAVLLFANGLLLGIWLWLPAVAFLAFALLGFALQSRNRS